MGGLKGNIKKKKKTEIFYTQKNSAFEIGKGNPRKKNKKIIREGFFFFPCLGALFG